MKRWLCIAALAAAASGSASPAISDFAWLAGAWCGERDGIAYEETWMAPRGGLALGLHRDIRNGKAIGFEFLRIEMRDGRPAYVSQPNGRPPTVFGLVSSTDRSAVFGNDQHDYPKRIRYERLDVSTLKARIDDGTEDGQAEEWVWRTCRSPFAL
jgi:Domain of unknown function (DUF6265)